MGFGFDLYQVHLYTHLDCAPEEGCVFCFPPNPEPELIVPEDDRP